MKQEHKAAYYTTLIAAVLFTLESIIDLLLIDVYVQSASEWLPASQTAELSSMLAILAIIGIVLSIAIVVFLLIEKHQLKQWHFITILVVAVLALFFTSALFALLILIVGSIMGIAKVKE